MSNEVKKIGQLSFNDRDKLGEGNFGIVYKGEFKNEESEIKDVAIKRIHINNDIEKVIFEKFEPHPNVLRYCCTEEDEDFLYIATELCAGTLEDIIQGKYEGQLVGSPREMMRQVARGLEHLHKNNIVHRDIKPENILVSFPDLQTGRRPQMKLADFGICRELKTDRAEISLTKLGTPGWKAPEMYSNKRIRAKDAFAVDIFSLGCVFGYFLSKGNQHPFGKDTLRWEHLIKNNEDVILIQNDFDHCGQSMFNLIRMMIFPLAKARYTITEVLKHPFFAEGIYSEQCSEDWNNAREEFLKSQAINGTYDVHYKDSRGRTPLMLLCRNTISGKLLDEIKNFLNLANVDAQVLNAKDESGNSAISLLCENYNGDDLIDVIRLFIERGVDIKEANPRNGLTLLMLVSIQYDREDLIEIVRLLIDYGIDINAKSGDGWNALHLVCRYYNHNKLIDVIALLIENGIDVNAVTTTIRWNAISFLSLYYGGDRMFDIIRLLIKNGINVTSQDNYGFNAFANVCSFYTRNDLIDIIRMMIAKDSSVIHTVTRINLKNSLLMVCFNYVMKGGDNLIDIILLLAESGIDVNHKDANNMNALMYICRNYRHDNLIEIVHLLVGYGNKIISKKENPLNLLHILSANTNLSHKICFDIFRHFIVDLKVDIVDNILTTLCENHGCCEKLVDILRLILDHSPIDIGFKNEAGEDAISILRKKSEYQRNVESAIKLLVGRKKLFITFFSCCPSLKINHKKRTGLLFYSQQ